MVLRTSYALACALFTAQLALPDVTMRSKMDYKSGSFLPAAAAEAMSKQLADTVANGIVVQIKGRRSVATTGPLVLISDQEKGTITLVDSKGKRYATTTIAEYSDKLKAAMPVMPPEAQKMLEGIKIDAKPERTGKISAIKGIKAEEMALLVSMEMPNPMGTSVTMRMEMHMWVATSEELDRVPALKEVATYMKNQAAGNDPAAVASRMFGSIPGFGDKLRKPMEELMNASSQAILRMEVKMIMPSAAQAMGASDPNEPMADMTTDLVELSSDPIPDSAFQPPAGYEVAKVEDLVRLIMPARPGAQ